MQKHDLTKPSFLLFLFVVGIRQLTAATATAMFSESIRDLAYVLTNILFIAVSILLIKTTHGSFRDHGFWIPRDWRGSLAVTLFLALAYMLITVFLPGSFWGFESFPTGSLSYFSLDFLNNLLTYFAVESVFRGYIQRNLTKAHGFYNALFMSAVMSILYVFSIQTYAQLDITTIVYTLSLFFEAVFLGFFFQRSRTLLCPIVFGAVASTLYRFTPLVVTAPQHTVLLFKVIAYVILVPSIYILLARKAEMVAR